jgi:peptidoglycan/LPS O-acetylase OafA/YrhL
LGASPGALQNNSSMVVITFVLVPLSWHFIESPLNNLKRFFPYIRRVATAPII